MIFIMISNLKFNKNTMNFTYYNKIIDKTNFELHL